MHPMVKQSKYNISKLKQLKFITTTHPLPISLDPSSVPVIKLSQWRHAMSNVLNALLHYSTWDLVPPDLSKNVVDSKWVLSITWDLDDSISGYKALLGAKGFHQ